MGWRFAKPVGGEPGIGVHRGREGSISPWRETDNQRLITPRQIIYHYRKSKLRNLNREVMSTLRSAPTRSRASSDHR
ncbi:hypothetical protein RHE_CH01090 [Rhizobium etli CFN 42]|uniref:Uncharacterized protein n=1 Tax=Rhizobium etli (strain ATCC 51251 / DSM 11541 / JCM 21823 / NBRC 15573 / CFN 42) TaxID=347834 RepID=Q2KB88_RHIEC|nr:hypothetical protein RHE_CH01090 [Rhizobium etli CFN 42]